MPVETSSDKRAAQSGVPATKDAIAQALRMRVVAGEYAPGARLPTRTELEQHFGTTKVTVQRAFDDLTEDGFIVSEGRRGTFVAEDPPHLTRYALAFAGAPKSGHAWSPFWEKLHNESVEIAKHEGRKIPVFYDVDRHQDAEGYRRLLYEMRTRQLAGVIFAFNPGFIEHTPLMDPYGIPLAAIVDDTRYGVPAVALGHASFFERALESLEKLGRKRVAVFVQESLFAGYDRFQKDAAKRGIEARPYWWLPASLDAPVMARSYAHLLMKPEQDARPDSVIIADDNFVDPVLAGLGDAGVRIPIDMSIVAHCNFPTTTANAVPMQRIGYDARTVLQASLDAIDLQREGKPVRPISLVNAVFEEQVEPARVV